MPSATVNGATLSYQWDGTETKPVLVLSNSLTTDMRMWEPLLPAFTEHFPEFFGIITVAMVDRLLRQGNTR